MEHPPFLKAYLFVGVWVALASQAHAAAISQEEKPQSHDPAFERLIVEKRALTKRLAAEHEVEVPGQVWSLFDAIQKGDWTSTTNQFYSIEAGTGRHGGAAWVPLAIWGPIHDTFGAYELFHEGDPRLLRRFSETVMKRIPDGSIYFGGTDAGRFLITAFSAAHTEARPFFTLTQNALADGSYLGYLRDLYGKKIYVPTRADAERIFNEYVASARKRADLSQLETGKPIELRENEFIQIIGNRMQVSGVAGVMTMNEMLARLIIDKNPSREIYLEESYPMEGLYGRSLPDGLIFKVSHRELEQVPPPVMKDDHQFWVDQCRALIGNAADETASVTGLCAWAEQIFLKPASAVFAGDSAYLKDPLAGRIFSQCRSGQAGYYAWWSQRMEKEPAELAREADFAHRQAVALAPYNPTAVWRYTRFLLQHKRTNDATVLIRSCLKIGPEKHMDVDSDQIQPALKKIREIEKSFPR
jgi:hypothetical protein